MMSHCGRLCQQPAAYLSSCLKIWAFSDFDSLSTFMPDFGRFLIYAYTKKFRRPRFSVRFLADLVVTPSKHKLESLMQRNGTVTAI